MSSYKLYYFHFRGRAEIIRLAFAIGNIPYEDVRLDWEQWAKEKLCEYYINFPEDETSSIYRKVTCIFCISNACH